MSSSSVSRSFPAHLHVAAMMMGDSNSAEQSVETDMPMTNTASGQCVDDKDAEHQVQGVERTSLSESACVSSGEQQQQKQHLEGAESGSELSLTLTLEQMEQSGGAESGSELSLTLTLEQMEQSGGAGSSHGEQQSSAKEDSFKQPEALKPSEDSFKEPEPLKPSEDSFKQPEALKPSEDSFRQPHPMTPTTSESSMATDGSGLQNGELVDSGSTGVEEEENHIEKTHTEEKSCSEEKTLVTVRADGEGGGRYHCSGCEVWGEAHAFEEHILRHILPEPYQCLYCPRCFATRHLVLSHVHQRHPGEKRSCALIDLQKAKGIMARARESGAHAFRACVAGKVPLVKPLSRSGDRQPKAAKTDHMSSMSGAKELGREAKQPAAHAVRCSETVRASESACAESPNDTTLKHLTSETPDNGDEDVCSEQCAGGDDQRVTGDSSQDGDDTDQTAHSEQSKSSDNHDDSPSSHDSSADKLENIGEDNSAVNEMNKSSEDNMNGVNGCHKEDDASLVPESSTSGLASNHVESELGEVNKTDSCAVDRLPDSPRCETSPAEGNTAKMEREDVRASGDSVDSVSDEKKCSDIDISQVDGDDHSESLDSSGRKNREFPASNFEQSEEDGNSSGLKIVAAFSLQDEDDEQHGLESQDTRGEGKECSPQRDSQPADEEAMDVDSTDLGSDSAAPEPGSPTAAETAATLRVLGPPSKPVPSFSFLGDPSPPCPAPCGEEEAESGSPGGFHLFICGFSCGFSCLTSGEFRDHLAADHAGEVVFHCFHCGFQAGGEEGLIRHISAHAHTYSKSVPLYSCGASACKFGSNLLSDFVTHQSTWHPDLTVFHCHDCDERFACVEDLLRHFEENCLHIINCPLCSAKSMERSTMLHHISTAHPGRPKMISVAKQIVCRDRKLNDYWAFVQRRFDTAMALSRSFSAETADAAVDLDQSKLGEQTGTGSVRNKCLLSILTGPLQSEEEELMKGVESPDRKGTLGEEGGGCNDSLDDSCEEDCSLEGRSGAGTPEVKREEILNFKCNFCTFVARDPSRLKGHEQGHSFPSSRKTRFKCMFCPQSFNNDDKFTSHVSCHPGLIRFNLYCCMKCKYDSNQRHILIKHARSTHKGSQSAEDDLYTMVSKTIESRVLECSQCCYMTRHRKHLVDHVKREHHSLKATGSSVPHSRGSNHREVSHSADLKDRSQGLATGNDGVVKENQSRRFKCPICQYLLARASDLQGHVKRHSELGEITLVMFRCKYCSASSTAREIVYSHLLEKHAGKQLALVKRIVKIDTRADDNGYAVTSVEDNKNSEVARSSLPAGAETPLVLVIPDSAGDTFQSPMHCPRCAFTSLSRPSIISHVSLLHGDVKLMGRRHDNEVYPLDVQRSLSTTDDGIASGEAWKGEILIVPDSLRFDEAVKCPRCDFATVHRRNMVLHLAENHPQVSVMGRNDHPTFEGADQATLESGGGGKEGTVVIGSGSLDDKLGCLYRSEGEGVKCLICGASRPRKFFIHLHLLRHLNVRLWGCCHCPHEGLQKYKMVDHIKKVHRGQAYCVRYLPVNVDQAVSRYLHNASRIQDRRGDGGGDRTSSEHGVATSLIQDGSEDRTATSSPGAGSLGAGLDHPEDLSGKRGGQDSLVGCLLGGEGLDMKLACLYSLQPGGLFRCVACGQELQRKFAMHRHLVQTHLRVNLIGCGYCGVEGVERHAVTEHILQAHPQAALSMRSLAHRLQEKVTHLLNSMTLTPDDDLGLPGSDSPREDGHPVAFKSPEVPSTAEALEAEGSKIPPPSLDVTATPSPAADGGGGVVGGGNGAVKNQPSSSLLLLGKDSLNTPLQRMFQRLPGPSMKFRCLVCRGIFDRRYAIHRHVLMKHLKLGIIGCPYCPFQGVERYQVFSHIKEEHRGAELHMRHLSVDLDSVVREYMRNVENGTVDPNSKAPPPWSMKKSTTGGVKREVVTCEEEEGSDPRPSTSSGAGQGLVVAMFGPRRLPLTIKTEPLDAEEEEMGQDALELRENGEEEGGQVQNGDGVGGVSDASQHSLNTSRTKVAVDVRTDIRVISTRVKGVRQHTCQRCKFTSVHRSNVVRHIYRVHEQYREQQCPFCSYRTLSLLLIQQHLNNEHPGLTLPEGLRLRGLKRKGGSLEGGALPKRYHLSSVDVEDLDALGHTYACGDCNYEARTQSEMDQHVRHRHSEGKEGESEDGEKEDREFVNLSHTVKMSQVNASHDGQDCLWQCFCCSYKTSSEENLKLHFVELHPNQPYRWRKVPVWRFVCSSCNVKTRAHSKMRYHLNRHIKYRPYTCTTCRAFYPSPDQCRKHCRANTHDPTFTYVRSERKEKRLRQLLRECQQNANALTASPSDPDVPEAAFAFPAPSKRKAKKSPSSSGIPAKLCKMEFEALDSSPHGGVDEREGRGAEEEEEELMGCTACDFTAQTVFGVKTHFLDVHPDQQFLWRDCTNSRVCKETGEITNGKEVSASLDSPPDGDYWTTGSGLLSCRHCPFTTTTVQAVKSHVKRHQPKKYLCPYCSMRCSRLDTVTMHVRCAHKGRDLWTIHFHLPEDFSLNLDDNEDSPIELAEPRVTFQMEEEEEEDDEEEKKGGSATPPPPRPPPTPSSRSSRLRHFSRGGPSMTGRVGCSQCEASFDIVAAAFQHHSASHPNLPFLWVDSSNGYTFNALGEVKDAKAHSPDLFSEEGFEVETDGGNIPTFCCRLCTFTSAYIQAIKSHMKSHLPHGFMCPYCSLTTSSKDKMQSHQSCVHKDKDSWVLHLRMI